MALLHVALALSTWHCGALHSARGTRAAPSTPPRREFFCAAGAAACLAVASPAAAKGRATQPALYLRYGPRIEKFGAYLAQDLDATVARGDWAKLEADCAAETGDKKGRKVGPIYSGTSAMSLWANTYSDVKPSPKTKAMQAEVDVIEAAREFLASQVACKGTGACLKAEGGILGFGGKAPPKPSDRELAASAASAAAQARQAFNRFVALNNEKPPVS
eukprot:CAMPEP_0119272476 /NCGR_PEP_ID=MMETSP1329-20130426/8635_1 /TAXON_ID=114041 /ORGANISM="Genus nov. species nov., Strain RCC1024" /LENGTH=217 /DNA_ID=CAMNT_0007272543 /DNA_START=120 /DNA_END=770 /DNA_ORIENTATION=+